MGLCGVLYRPGMDGMSTRESPGISLTEVEVNLATALVSPWRPARWRDGEVAGRRGVENWCQQRWWRGGESLGLGTWSRWRGKPGWQSGSHGGALAGEGNRGGETVGASWREERGASRGEVGQGRSRNPGGALDGGATANG